MSDPAVQAMAAVEQALQASEAETVKVASRMAEEIREEVRTLVTYLLTPVTSESKPDGTKAKEALASLAARMCVSIVDDPDYCDDWDGDYLTCDGADLEEARRRALCRQFNDALHHLERALPEGFGVIAERIASHLRTSP